MGFEHFHIGKAGAPFSHGPKTTPPANRVKRADSTTSDPSCATGAFYAAPALSATIDSLQPLNIAWRPELACFLPAPAQVDVILTAPGSDSPSIYTWENVPYAAGNQTVNLLPRWWNSTSSIALQIMIVPAGTPVFLSAIPAGPVFSANYTAPADGTPASADLGQKGSDSDHTVVSPSSNLSGISSHSLTPGKKAAAVLLPLLFVLLLGLAYLKISRARGAAKRSAWSEKLDKRMSTISTDWKSITPGGAREAVRASIAASRNSVFGFGAITPGAPEGEPVVMGEKALPGMPRGGSIEISEKEYPRTSLGSGVGVGVGARRPKTHATPPERGSRAVSFADSAHPRPSMNSARYSRGSRAFHTASTYEDFEGEEAPPVPALPSPARAGAFGAISAISTGSGAPPSYGSPTTPSAQQGQGVYQNASAWSSGERVEGVDGGYGARSVSPTGRVHTVNYPTPATLSTYGEYGHGEDGFAYGTPSNMDGSYFSPVTPTPGAMGFAGMGMVEEPSADSAYAENTFGSYASHYQIHPQGSPNLSESSTPSMPSGVSSPRQIGGPLTLTPEDIRRRMTLQQHNPGQEQWRQSVDEVFGALSLMRTGTDPTSSSSDNDAEDDGGDYLFAPVQETVFAYPGTPAPGSSGFGSDPWSAQSVRGVARDVLAATTFLAKIEAVGPEVQAASAVLLVRGNRSVLDSARDVDAEFPYMGTRLGHFLMARTCKLVHVLPSLPSSLPPSHASRLLTPLAFADTQVPSSPFAMPMQPPTMSPDAMLRAYAAKHASTSGTPSPLSHTTAGAEVVSSIKGTGMRVLYKQPDETANANGSAGGGMIRAGPGARLSR
ncbi:hypothetical protein B0H19DRAFT_1271571 [Mycena capillaripes]|nr:hypothetical protein B0H19DRAFT_1271571 [Mycena capillaripes]